MPNASMICEKPLKSAKKPTQNKIRNVRWPKAYTRSDPDTQNASRTSRIPVLNRRQSMMDQLVLTRRQEKKQLMQLMT